MKQGGKPHIKAPPLVSGMLERAEVMLKHVVAIGLVLLYPYPLSELGGDIAQDPHTLRQNKGFHRAVGVEYPHKFVPDTLFGDLRELVFGQYNSLFSLAFYREVKLCKQAY